MARITAFLPSAHGIPTAPISAAQRRMLHARLDDLPGTAKRNGHTLNNWERIIEDQAGRLHFEVGAWGYWASLRRDRLSVADRARVTFAVLASGRTSVGYEFFTAFNFGERDFDSFFEMGDGDQVVEAVSALVRQTGNAVAADALRKNGWEIAERQQGLFATTESAAA